MRKIVFISLLLLSTSSADELWGFSQKGKKLYKKGEFDKALEQFDSAAVKAPGSSEAQFNRALTLAQLGQIEEAKKVLTGLRFKDSSKSAELSYTSGKVADIEGEAAVKKQDMGAAKKAYTEAIRHYVDALSSDSSHSDALNNVEIAAGNLAKIPDQPENQDQNKDDQNKDDQNKDDQKKDDQEKDDQEKDDQEKDDQEKDDQEKDDQQQQPEQPDSTQINAMQLLERYGDDAKELNKPPKGKAVPVSGGKDW